MRDRIILSDADFRQEAAISLYGSVFLHPPERDGKCTKNTSNVPMYLQ